MEDAGRRLSEPGHPDGTLATRHVDAKLTETQGGDARVGVRKMVTEAMGADTTDNKKFRG